MRREALEACKKGAFKSEKSVKKRLATMGMTDDGVMTYRLGGGGLWYSCWELLDEDEKAEARGTMRREALDADSLGKSEQAKRALEMGLGPKAHMTYDMTLGTAVCTIPFCIS